jgi:hypothetical protein
MKTEIISRAVGILRESPTCSDDEIYLRLVAAGIKPEYAARLVELLPMAYCRLVLAGSGMRFPEVFQRKLRDGSISTEQALTSEPLWNDVLSFARTEQERGATGKDMLAIAAHSAEFDAVNQLLNKGAKAEDIVLTSPVFKWPDEGPAI